MVATKTGPVSQVNRRAFLVAAGAALATLHLAPAAAPRAPAPEAPKMHIVSVHRHHDRVVLMLNAGQLSIQVFDPRTVRVLFIPTGSHEPPPSLAVVAKPFTAGWTMHNTPTHVAVLTEKLELRVQHATAAVSLHDHAGKTVLTEPPRGKACTAKHFKDVPTFEVAQTFNLGHDEAIYGLGQHQHGVMNYRGHNVVLQQKNRHVAVPVMVSSQGYGIFWDNPAITHVSVGERRSPGTLHWRSDVGAGIDYYLFLGPQLDDVIAAHRRLTGAAPMFGRWVWGFWQCKEHYNTQLQVLGVATEYRSMDVPIDGIIQDWFYWVPHPWGSNQFDWKRYPDPAGMIAELHKENLHFMISVWAKFAPGSENYRVLHKAGVLYPLTGGGNTKWNPGTSYYDPFNPLGRKLYWAALNKELFSKGVDAWWLDASEPELGMRWGEFANIKTHLGWGAFVYNAYPLMHTMAVYQGQRATSDAKRVMILTRSAWAGQQRNAAITWSGDTQGNWKVFAAQIPAGLNFALSGIPYWNTDIGGFFGARLNNPAYTELFIRWYQFGAFCPLFRVHGTSAPKEMWRFGEKAMGTLVKFDHLRYRLLPYIYSVAWKVTSDGYTMYRPLVMDFTHDRKVHRIADQFMFGPAIMVSPVIHAGANHRLVYLPAGTRWLDFWTGDTHAGGNTVNAPAPIDSLPLFVRAGSIIPWGPAVQNAQQPTDPIDLRIYPGADGQFTLYEDEGDNYNYERGTYTTIAIAWDDRGRRLTIGPRKGSFPGMLQQRTFRMVLVRPGHGIGLEPPGADAVIHYDGTQAVVTL